MRKVIVLGNCVAERLGLILASIFSYVNENQPSNQWELIPCPPIYNVKGMEGWQKQADLAASADLVFTQPLFNFGPCNTSELQKRHCSHLHVFSAPNFEAYFPDCLETGYHSQKLKMPPPLDWHSKILLQCKAGNIPPEEVPGIWKNHPVFKKDSLLKAIDASFALYEKRETNVEIGTLETVKELYRKEPLFFSFRHPGDRIFRKMLGGMLPFMDYSPSVAESILRRVPFRENLSDPHAWSEWGFGFNAWPIMAADQNVFDFPNRDFFRIAGSEYNFTEAAKLWYAWYDEHPDQFSLLLAAAAKSVHN